MNRIIKLFSTVMLVFAFSSCLSHRMQDPLKLEVASSQRWDAGEKHRGIQLDLILVGDTEFVKVTDLIFRGKRIKPTVKKKDGKLLVTANFESGLENKAVKVKMVDKADMIIYTHKGKVYELLLDHIQPKPMQYYPKQ